MGYTYVMSDIHGMYEEYMKMIKKISLREQDRLYILGDVIDRGNEGIRIILDIMSRKNVMMLLGNHEAMMLDVVTLDDFDGDIFHDRMFRWQKNGGRVTAQYYFNNLNYKEQIKINTFLENCPMFLTIDVLGKPYYLVHAFPKVKESSNNKENNIVTFNSLRKLPEKDAKSLLLTLLWRRIESKDDFSKYPHVIVGHTPTIWYQDNLPMKIWYGNNIMDIDCGCSYLANGRKEGALGCLRLDDGKEFYIGYVGI